MSKWKIDDIELANQVVVAPMAGISNQAFRSIVREQHPGLVYAEMVSTNGLLYDSKKTLKMLETQESDRPLTMQVFGGDKYVMKEGAILVDEKCDADIIDVNFGCPAGKVNKSGGGAKWMLNPDGAKEAVELIIQNVKKPVTTKFRIGWDDDHINVVEFAKAMEAAGAKAVAVHGRTRQQMYEGHANWDYIRQVKEAVSIPVIGNGDIRSPQDAKRMLEETGCDAVMIGRGVLGNPWLIGDTISYLDGKEIISTVSIVDRFENCKEMARRLIAIRPTEQIAMSQMRSHALWYVKGIPNSHRVKEQLSKLNTYEDLERTLNDYLLYLKENGYLD